MVTLLVTVTTMTTTTNTTNMYYRNTVIRQRNSFTIRQKVNYENKLNIANLKSKTSFRRQKI